MAIINKSTKSKCWWRCGEKGTLLHCLWERRLVQPLWKAVWRYHKKIKTGSAFWPSNSTSGNISKGTQNTNLKEHKHPCVHCNVICNHQDMEQPKCPSVDEWIKQLWDIYTMEYYIAGKRKKILPSTIVQMDLENIMLSEISRSEKDKYQMISLICVI